MVYIGHRCQLNHRHPYYQNKCWFDDKLETKGTPRLVFPKQTLQNAKSCVNWIKEGGVPRSTNDLVHKHGMKHKSLLWTLKYWLVSMFDTKTIHKTKKIQFIPIDMY
jgi:hypothetical protein